MPVSYNDVERYPMTVRYVAATSSPQPKLPEIPEWEEVSDEEIDTPKLISYLCPLCAMIYNSGTKCNWSKLELEGVQKTPIGAGCTVAASDGRKAIGRT